MPKRAVALTLSGHIANGPAIVRQSRYCLDEGLFDYRESLLAVSRGVGSIVLPFRWGADPEAVLPELTPPS